MAVWVFRRSGYGRNMSHVLTFSNVELTFFSEEIYDQLVGEVSLWPGSSTPKDNNVWNAKSFMPLFPVNPNKEEGDFVEGYSTFVYALGDVSEQSLNLQRVFVYYLSVSLFSRSRTLRLMVYA